MNNMSDIPEFKKELKQKLHKINTSRDFIVTVGTLAGGTKEDADRVMNFMNDNPDATTLEIINYAGKIWLEHEIKKQSN